MTLKRRTFNPKRRLCPADVAAARIEELLAKADRLRYSGNSEHKRNPGDFGLTPPSGPRPSKTLCDEVGVFTRREATALLVSGLKRGAFSEQERNGWPQNVWAVTDGGKALEAQLEGDGVYHGYPMPEEDPMSDKILEMWRWE